MQLTIRPAHKNDLVEVQEWNDADTGPGEYVGAYGPHASVIDTDNPDSGWAGFDGDEMVAYASFTATPEHHAIIGFIVKPSRRREGIAKTFISLLLERQELANFTKIIGTPQFNDVAALKILQRAGFHQTGYDEEGLVVFERR